MSGASGTPSACSTSPTRPCIRSTRSQRSASSSRDCAKANAVPARPTTIPASSENFMAPRSRPSSGPDRRVPGGTQAEGSGVDGCRSRRESVEPLALRHVTCGALAAGGLRGHLAEQAGTLGHDVVLVDRLEVLLPSHDERVRLELAELVERHPDLLADAVLDEARAAVGALHDGELVGALHQLEDLRAHRLLNDAQQVRAVDLTVAALRAADPERAEPALVVRRDRHMLEDALDLVVGEAVRQQALARGGRDHLLRARACGHALRRDADEPTRAAL